MVFTIFFWIYVQIVDIFFLIKASPLKHVKSCGICGKSHDQHLLAHCDTCQHHYHLGCLTPPLTRMPKKSKQWGWSCSECYPDSSDDEKQIVIDFDEASGRRRQRRQAAASKALQMASSSGEDDNREILKKVKKQSLEDNREIIKKAVKKQSIEDNREVMKKVKKEPLAIAPSSTTSAQQQLHNFTAQLTVSQIYHLKYDLVSRQ